MNVSRGLAIATLVFLAMTARATATTCTGSVYRQLDFFVGNWVVFNKAGKQIATDRVTKEFGGCVIWEQWFSPHSRGAGYSGYVPLRHRWVQTYMDDAGTVLVFEGGPSGKSFVIAGPSYGTPNIVEQNRVIFRSLNHGVVEEYWTLSTDNGKTSKVVFDGFFHPRR